MAIFLNILDKRNKARKRYKTKKSKHKLITPPSNQIGNGQGLPLVDLGRLYSTSINNGVELQKEKIHQTQNKKSKILEPKFRNIPFNVERQKLLPSPSPTTYRRRQLNVKEVDKSKVIVNKTYKHSNNLNGFKKLMEWFSRIWSSNSNRRQTERQGEFAAPFVLNSVGAGIAAVASLVGLVAVARSPFARVLSDVSPLQQVQNGNYANYNLKIVSYI